MSYCRFSSDDFNSDIYCYGSVDGYVIHIAANRYKGDISKLNFETINLLETAEIETINLPYAGESFTVDTLQELKETLLKLKQIGYHVPDSAFKRINKEMKKE